MYCYYGTFMDSKNSSVLFLLNFCFSESFVEHFVKPLNNDLNCFAFQPEKM